LSGRGSRPRLRRAARAILEEALVAADPLRLPAASFLASSDTRDFLGPLGDLIVTGPTGTNVCDVVVWPAGRPASRRL